LRGHLYSGNWRDRRYLIDKQGNFPSGLLNKVKKWLIVNKIEHSLLDERIRPITGECIFDAIWPHNLYLEQQEAILEAKSRGCGVVRAPTGSGKSIIIAGIIHQMNLPTLVVVPTLELKRQTQATMDQIFGETSHLIKVRNVASLNPKELETSDVVIIDEWHHAAAATYRKLNKYAWKNVYHRFGLSATPSRTNAEENILLEAIIADTIYEISHETAVSKNYIVPVEAYYIDLPKVKVKGHTWAQVYSELVVNRKDRNDLIAWLLMKFHQKKKSTLCLVKEIEHGNKLVELTGCGFANGADDNSRLSISGFNELKLTCLIGTEGILGEGVDTKPCEYVIVAGLGKSRPALMQKCGRAFRVYPGKESAKIILFKDPSHKWTLNHFREQCKTIEEEYGVTVKELK
jgi:superfamily II DNA or RNA helicase